MDNKTANLIARGYKALVGEFDVKTLIYLISVFVVTAVLPFLRPDFDWDDITWMFILITIVKMAMNLQTKKMMAVHTTDKGLATNKDIVKTHEDISTVRQSIEKAKYNRFLPKAVREENLKVDLNTLYTNINNLMIKSKDDNEVLKHTETLEQIEEILDLIENDQPYKEQKKALINKLANVKKSNLTVASLYSKNDSIDRVKKYDLDIDLAITKMTQRSAIVSIIMVAIINGLTFIYLGANKDTIFQSILNTAMLMFSGVMGVDTGRKIVKQYANVVGEKLEFLKSFLTKAEHYAKPSEEELAKQKEEERLKEERKRDEEMAKLERERQYEIDKLKADREHELEKARIQMELEKAKAQIYARKHEDTHTATKEDKTNENKQTVEFVLKQK